MHLTEKMSYKAREKNTCKGYKQDFTEANKNLQLQLETFLSCRGDFLKIHMEE